LTLGITYRIPSIFLTLFVSARVSRRSLRNPRFFFADFVSKLWLRIAGRRLIFPVPVSLKRFFAPLCVFVFGIVFHSCVLCRAQQHHHVATVEERLGLDRPDLLDVLREPEE